MALGLLALAVGMLAGAAAAPGGAERAPSSVDCISKEGTLTADVPEPPDGEQSLEWQVGQMLMAGVAGTALSDDARHVIGDLRVGNVVLMGPNVESPAQVAQLTRELQVLARQANGVGLLIATDQEGGRVQRLREGFTALPDAAAVGSAGRPELARAYGAMVGAELAAVGANVDLAPVLDINDNPANPVIGRRAFGQDPATVTAAALGFAVGLHDAGVIATGKHFPGHGNTSTDSHFTVPVVPKDRAGLDRVELAPFRAAARSGVDAIMLAHVVFPALDPSGVPATVSFPIASCLLRGELGFEGVVLTDDMGMQGIQDLYSPEEAAVRAVLAGADVVVCARVEIPGACPPAMLERLRDGLMRAAAEGRVPRARIADAVSRVLALKARYRVGEVESGGTALIGGPAHQQLVAEIDTAAAGR
jgi:beta-N-acetylhexosaminidase